jgi:hypothetical protein
VRTAPPRELLALGLGYRNSFGRLDEAIPDPLKQLQPVGDAKRLNVLAYDTHGRILRFLTGPRKALSVWITLPLSHEAPPMLPLPHPPLARPPLVGCSGLLDGGSDAKEVHRDAAVGRSPTNIG